LGAENRLKRARSEAAVPQRWSRRTLPGVGRTLE